MEVSVADLQEMLIILDKWCGVFGQRISLKKTKVMSSEASPTHIDSSDSDEEDSEDEDEEEEGGRRTPSQGERQRVTSPKHRTRPSCCGVRSCNE